MYRINPNNGKISLGADAGIPSFGGLSRPAPLLNLSHFSTDLSANEGCAALLILKIKSLAWAFWEPKELIVSEIEKGHAQCLKSAFDKENELDVDMVVPYDRLETESMSKVVASLPSRRLLPPLFFAASLIETQKNQEVFELLQERFPFNAFHTGRLLCGPHFNYPAFRECCLANSDSLKKMLAQCGMYAALQNLISDYIYSESSSNQASSNNAPVSDSGVHCEGGIYQMVTSSDDGQTSGTKRKFQETLPQHDVNGLDADERPTKLAKVDNADQASSSNAQSGNQTNAPDEPKQMES